MIKRINLIEKKPFTFTYQRLIQICLCALLLLAAMIGTSVLQTQRLQKKIATIQQGITQLEIKKEELTKQKSVKKTVSVGEYQELFDLIQNTLRWSTIITDIGQRLPQTVWMTQFQSASSLVAVTLAEEDKPGKSSGKKTAPQSTLKVAKNTVQINGVSSDMRSITEFTAKVARIEYLQNVILDESIRQGYGFMFKLTGEINPHAQ